MKDDGIALFCTLHPQTLEKQERCLSLLRRSARDYYRHPAAQCSTWSYFTPLSPSTTTSSPEPVICGLEIYTTKSALQSQINDKQFFQSYHNTVKREGLYARPEELVAWYLADGFMVGRSGKGREGCVVSVTKLVCKKDAEGVLGVLRPFAQWVHDFEPNAVFTYAIFTRSKAPREVMLIVRYADTQAMEAHDRAPEHRAVVKELGKRIVKAENTFWKEVEGSFVGNEAGGGAKL